MSLSAKLLFATLLLLADATELGGCELPLEEEDPNIVGAEEGKMLEIFDGLVAGADNPAKLANGLLAGAGASAGAVLGA